MDNKNEAQIIWFKDLGIEDIHLVGGKNAALGEMISKLSPLGIRVPDGFAITAKAYRHLIVDSGLMDQIRQALAGLDTHNVRDLQTRGAKVRSLIMKAELPADLRDLIIEHYRQLQDQSGSALSLAVRSSATAEDLPDASFAGQQETYLNVRGDQELLLAVKKCIASLFTDRAISYRTDKGFSHFDVALSVGVQRMVRSDLGSSGVCFTIDTETGFNQVVQINASWGLGEMVVKGQVTPDEYLVFKPALDKGLTTVLSKTPGPKDVKMIYGTKGTKVVKVPTKDQWRYALADDEIIQLATWAVTIEKYFSTKKGRYQPMDIEWARDGESGELFIVQARPETVHSLADKNLFTEYRLAEPGPVLITGTAVGSKIATGKVRIIKETKKLNEFKRGEILVTEITDPDWEPIMKIASAIITDRGGRTSHAAIVSRELGVPCVVGCGDATRRLKNGQEVTIDCSSGELGVVYRGKLPFTIKENRLDKIPEIKTALLVNVGSPEEAFRYANLPVSGVGLGRLEFIINSYIKVHPQALIDYPKLKRQTDAKTKRLVKTIDELTPNYQDKKQFYVDELAEGVSRIAAAFYPREVVIRFSDFKTNEYCALLGGDRYEPTEANPMIGWRGASRYYDPKFQSAFALECQALARARQEQGLDNIVPMIPFCRTPEEADKVLAVMAENGLSRHRDTKLKIYVMCEIPSNILRAEEFLERFDGMSIGSNDLAQLTLGLDRDSNLVAKVANENDPAVKSLIETVIKACLARDKYIGICGQAPSDYPEFAEFLVRAGISSMSLNPDVVLKSLQLIADAELKVKHNL